MTLGIEPQFPASSENAKSAVDKGSARGVDERVPDGAGLRSGGVMQLAQHRGLGWRLSMGLLGALAGYITLALTSTLVQEVWLGGVSYRDSGPLVLLLASLFTPLCALVGGLVGALLAGQSRWLAAATLCGLIAVESTYLYITERVDGPLWFEAGAAAALILAVCAATWLTARYVARWLNNRSNAQ